MTLKLLALTFLIISLAVTPVYATPSYYVHSSVPFYLNHRNPYAAGPTFHLGGGCWVWTDWNDLRITQLFVDSGGYTWFNYTVDFTYSAAQQKVFAALYSISKLYVNDVLYLEDHPSSACYWYESLGIVYVTLGGVSKPAKVSIAYEIPPPPVMVVISINAFNYSDSTSISVGTVMVDDLTGNQTILDLPTAFSILNGSTYELTFYGTAEWNYTIGRNVNTASDITNPYREEFTENTALSIYFTAIAPYNYWPVPIIFIFGMAGLACMFIGPTYAINKMKQKEYRQGLVWGVILTSLGFSLFIAWLFGGVF